MCSVLESPVWHQAALNQAIRLKNIKHNDMESLTGLCESSSCSKCMKMFSARGSKDALVSFHREDKELPPVSPACYNKSHLCDTCFNQS